MRLITSPVQLPGVPVGFPQFDDYSGQLVSPLPLQYHFVDYSEGTDEWIIYDNGGEEQPPYAVPAGYLWQSSQVTSAPDGTNWIESTAWNVAPIPLPGSSWARNHGLVALEAKITTIPISAVEMAFLEGQNGYGRGSSIAPSGWIADKAMGNQQAIWNDFVARIEDLEAPGDFLGINGLGTPDDWGPTIVILAAFSGGAADALAAPATATAAAATATAAAASGAAVSTAAVDSVSLAAADAAGGLLPAFGTQAAYDASLALADQAGGLLPEFGTSVAYADAIGAPATVTAAASATSAVTTSAADSISLNAADDAAGLTPQYGASVSYSSAIASPTSAEILGAADAAGGLVPEFGTQAAYDAAIGGGAGGATSSILETAKAYVAKAASVPAVKQAINSAVAKVSHALSGAPAAGEKPAAQQAPAGSIDAGAGAALALTAIGVLLVKALLA